mgnify:CR=1 FL=1
MKTLLIYDENGKVFFNISGNENDLPIPNGLNYILTEIPEGKRLADVPYQIDLTDGEPKVLLEDLPKTEIQLLQEELKMTQEVLNFLIMDPK